MNAFTIVIVLVAALAFLLALIFSFIGARQKRAMGSFLGIVFAGGGSAVCHMAW